MTLEVLPLTPERWEDLERLFGPRGAVAGCWCMWWRQTAREFERKAGDANRSELRALVDSGRPPGLLAYDDGEPVGWCSLAPREEFGRVERSPHLKRPDDRPVWSIVCFYIHRRHRRQGVARALLDAAVEHAAEQGAELVEGYPVPAESLGGGWDDGYTGVVSMFEEAGFETAARPRGKRRLMRREL